METIISNHFSSTDSTTAYTSLSPSPVLADMTIMPIICINPTLDVLPAILPTPPSILHRKRCLTLHVVSPLVSALPRIWCLAIIGSHPTAADHPAVLVHFSLRPHVSHNLPQIERLIISKIIVHTLCLSLSHPHKHCNSTVPDSCSHNLPVV